MIRMLLTTLCLCTGLSAGAQTVSLKGTCADSAFNGMRFYVRTLDYQQDGNASAMQMNGASFSGNAAVSPVGIYYICGASNSSQLMVPVYLPDSTKTYDVNLTAVDGCPQVNIDNDNKALSAFNLLYYKRERTFWTEAKAWSVDQFQPFLKGYITTADSIINAYKCSQNVSQFLKLWALSSASSDYASIQHVTGLKPTAIPFTERDLLGILPQSLDMPMTVFFPSLIQSVTQAIPSGNLTESVSFVVDSIRSTELQQAVLSMTLTNYIRHFDFNKDYEQGLRELTSLTEKYKLNERYVRDFTARRASAKGRPFPSVTLMDTKGERVDFSKYKGSYIYVDMWASWCGPCCKEAPYLKALEKELADLPNLKFVSISIDKKTEAWRKKMTELGLSDENQLINQDNSLAEALNVKGIPFFLIYDKEGKLYMYNAPRPSNPELKSMLQKLCEKQ